MKKILLFCALFAVGGAITPPIASARTTTQATAQAKTATANGVVKDAAGLPVVGVTVVLPNGTFGAMTDVTGSFSIPNIEVGGSLGFNFVGYLTQKVVFQGEAMNVVMIEDAQDIEQVVVTGYTSQRKTAMTGSVATISGDKLNDMAKPDVASLLQGKVAGVVANASSGKPGEGSSIRIRGKGSLSSTVDPLWVVDGVIMSTEPSLSPNEIENMSVLKDASATALYGSRGANGVIVITTKNGKYNSGSALSVSVNVGAVELSMGNQDMMNSQELYDYEKTFNNNAWFTENLLKHDTDWFKEATQIGFYNNANISYAGGGEKIRSYFLIDYYSEEGAVKTTTYDRISLRANNDYKLDENVTFFNKINASYTNKNDQSPSLYYVNLLLPWDYPYNEDGSVRTGKESDWYGRDQTNFLEYRDLNWNKTKSINLNAVIGLTWGITDWLSFESNNSAQYNYSLNEQYVDQNTIGGAADNGSIYNYTRLRENYFLNQMLKFNKTWGKHEVNALAAYEFTRQSAQDFSAAGRGLVSGKEIIDVTTGMKSMTGTKDAFNVQSFLFNLNYGYDNRYMFQASYRVDGSSKFGENNQYGNFFTVAGGWNIHNEQFFEGARQVMNQLKLRLSYGSVGNMPTAAYGHYSLYDGGQYNQRPAFFPSQLGNPDLTWEKCYTTNIGVDMSFFNSRLNVSLDFYDKNTSDLLYYVALTTVTGYSGQWQNIGAVNNRGIEVDINATPIQTKDWMWNIGFNIGFNKNTIKELYGGKAQISGYKRFEEGRDMDQYWMYEWAGVDPQNGDPLWYTRDAGTGEINGTTNTYAKASRGYAGSAAPLFAGGFNTSLTWKNLSLSMDFAYSYGNQIYAAYREMVDNDGGYLDFNAINLRPGWSRWEKPGDVATHPLAKKGGNLQAFKPSSRYLEDGSYLTLRNVNLRYLMPSTLMQKGGFKSMSFQFGVDNLFTLTNFSGPSPEAGTAGSDLASHVTAGTAGIGLYPLTRKYVFSWNFTF